MEPNTLMKIFLVDDEPFCLHLYGQYLKNLGITQVQSFGNSGDCLNQLVLRPDLIFLDYNMDNLTGIDILKKIKRFDPNIPVVFISGQEDIKVAVNALKYGAFDYLTKDSLDESKMKACLDKILLIKEMMAKKNRRSGIRKILSGAGVLSAVYFIQKLFANQ
jgi:DNA-binding NtrC family response regulator